MESVRCLAGAASIDATNLVAFCVGACCAWFTSRALCVRPAIQKKSPAIAELFFSTKVDSARRDGRDESRPFLLALEGVFRWKCCRLAEGDGGNERRTVAQAHRIAGVAIRGARCHASLIGRDAGVAVRLRASGRGQSEGGQCNYGQAS